MMTIPPALTVFTIGHSTHPIAEFVEILTAHGVETVVDIRTVPRSRHNPHMLTSFAEVHGQKITYPQYNDPAKHG
jgi:uncharacterized protein (DUF488 family)